MSLGTLYTHLRRVRCNPPKLYAAIRKVRRAQLAVRHNNAVAKSGCIQERISGALEEASCTCSLATGDAEPHPARISPPLGPVYPRGSRFFHGRENQLVTIMNTPRQLTSNAPWTAIATRAKAGVKARSVSKARANSATNPHRSQINGILHAVVLRLWSVESLYAPNHGEMTHHTIANGSAVRSNALL